MFKDKSTLEQLNVALDCFFGTCFIVTLGILFYYVFFL